MPSGKLKTYRSKRDFKKTAEPSGAQKAAPSKNLRFVIQKHAATRLHYDFRLEIGAVFWSWAVTRGPSLDPHEKRLAVETEAHPLDYGDFEGTIPRGQYGGGTVMLWDRGYWAPEPGFEPEKAIKNGELKFVVKGEKINGGFVLDEVSASSDDPYYFGTQLRLESKWSKRVSTSAGLMWLAFANEELLSNGAMPNKIPVTIEITSVNNTTIGSRATAVARGRLSGFAASSARRPEKPRATPIAPPMRASSIPSVRNCFTSLKRPAPRAERIANSF